MDIRPSFFTSPTFSFVNETIVFLKAQHKKILIVLTLAFSCLALLYLSKKNHSKLRKLNSDAKPSSQHQANLNVKTIEKPSPKKIPPLERVTLPLDVSLKKQKPSEVNSDCLGEKTNEKTLFLDDGSPLSPPVDSFIDVEASSLEADEELNTSDKLDTQDFAPFPFLKLPLPMQFYVCSFLPPIEIVRHQEISKQVQGPLTTYYFKRLSVQLELLLDLDKAYAKNKAAKNKAAKIKDQWDACLESILSDKRLKSFFNDHPTAQNDFFAYFTSKNRLKFDWNKNLALFSFILDLFFEQATDGQLVSFIKKDACALRKNVVVGVELTHPSVTQLFFKNLTKEREKRLADLPIETLLLQAMSCIPELNRHLFALLYNKNPASTVWGDIRYHASSYSSLINLLVPTWLLDTLALCKQYPNDPSLAVKLSNLFNGFKFPGSSEKALEEFAFDFLTSAESLNTHQIEAFDFLTSAESLNTHQIEAFAWGLTRAPLFVEKGYDVMFVRTILRSSPTSLQQQGLLNSEQIIAALLKEFIACNVGLKTTGGGDLQGFIAEISSKERMEALIEAVKAIPEPWRTLSLRLFVLNNDSAQTTEVSLEDRFVLNNVSAQTTKVSLEDRVEVFNTCGLDYWSYEFIKPTYFSDAFRGSTRVYLEELQNLNDEKELKELANFALSPAHILRALAGGIVVSKDVLLKPALDSETIKQVFVQKGLSFDFFNQPISIEEFVKANKDLA